MNILKNRKFQIGLVIALEAAAVGLILYLVFLPFYPAVKYRLRYDEPEVTALAQDPEAVRDRVEEIKSGLPEAAYAVSPNRVIIPKIGVNAPIVEARTAEAGLDRGAWRVPDSSTPEKGGNTVITGHRFKYLPPNNLTFYLFDKMAAGDLVSVIWEERDYLYRVREVRIVDRTEVSILDPSDKPILTMFTCHPVYSTAQRIVIVADLVEDGDGGGI